MYIQFVGGKKRARLHLYLHPLLVHTFLPLHRLAFLQSALDLVQLLGDASLLHLKRIVHL